MKLLDRYDYDTNKPFPGYEGNIMGEWNGIVWESDIAEVLKRNP
jgi:hypothetical protein